MNAPTRPNPPDAVEHRFTIAEVVRLSEGGFLAAEGRIELVDGRIEIMPVDGELHVYALQVLARFFNERTLSVPVLSAAVDVRIKATLKIDDHHAREPDLMITRRFHGVRFPAPGDVALIVETCVSSTTRDLEEKRRVYATVGVSEYWVWEAEAETMHVFRAPADGDYQSKEKLGAGACINPLFEPAIELAVDALIPS